MKKFMIILARNNMITEVCVILQPRVNWCVIYKIIKTNCICK